MTVKFSLSFWCGFVLGLVNAPPAVAAVSPDYAVVVSQPTQADPGWRLVVDALQQAHQAAILVYTNSVAETLPRLRALAPRYVCFVAQPAEATRECAAQIHRLTRKLNDDPYADCIWGVLTGYDAANALRIAQRREPLTVNKVASGTEIALELCKEGVWFSELKAGHMVRKAPGGKPTTLEGPADSTPAIVRTLNEDRPDLFITSGHATERDWQIGYGYRSGQFRCENGKLYGLDTQKARHPILSPNPKVYLPVGNCLMGHIDGPNAMALAFLNSAGVHQMIGYTVTSWYGYAGWGCLDYFVEQPGRYTLAEAFFANHAALIHRLHTYFPDLVAAPLDANGRPAQEIEETAAAKAAGLTSKDALGLLHDRDPVAFYGDPAWAARMAPGELAWNQTLTEKDGVWTFTVKPNGGEQSYEPTSRNGSQRGGRPFVQFLPRRLQQVQILAGADLQPVITANFILLPRSRASHPDYRVVFRTATHP